MPTTAIIIVVAIVAVVAAVFVTRSVTLSSKEKEDKAKVDSAEHKAREIIDEALRVAETKKREALLEAKEARFQVHSLNSPTRLMSVLSFTSPLEKSA